ncbi:monocarboxylate transporter 10 isoform X2 [Patella vulgata]|nr:monocarboxylate transporter 10 isoform X2 [Patella vulgata]
MEVNNSANVDATMKDVENIPTDELPDSVVKQESDCTPLQVDGFSDSVINQKSDCTPWQADGLPDSKLTNTNNFKPPDGGWGWFVCFTALVANGTVIAIINTYGIIYVAIEDKFSTKEQSIAFKTSLVGSVCTAMTFLMCIVASILSDKIGIRQTAALGAVLGIIGLLGSAFVETLEILYLTYGIFLGLGSAFVLFPSVFILGHYFRKHLGLVNGIVTFGGGVFTICSSLSFPILFKNIGLKYTFIILSGFYLISLGCTLTWKPLLPKQPDTTTGKEADTGESSCCRSLVGYLNMGIWKNKDYVVWSLSVFLSLFGYLVPFYHLPKYSEQLFPGSKGSYLVLCLNIASCVGKLVCGKLADLPCANRVRMQQAAFGVVGVVTMCIPLAEHYYSLIAVSLIIGACDGFFLCLIGPIAFDLVGPIDASQAIGFAFGMAAIPLSVGPPVAGALYDNLGSYPIAFHLAGVPPVIGALGMFFVKKKPRPLATQSEEQMNMLTEL